MKQFFLAFFAILTVASCKSDSSKNDAIATDSPTISYTDKNFIGNEQISNGDTVRTEMHFKFPVFSGMDDAINKKINAYIFSFAQTNMYDEEDTVPKKYNSLDEVASNFFKAAKENEMPDFPSSIAWFSEFETDTLMLDVANQRLTLLHEYASFTGGAHPNSFTQISNIDLKTGEVISTEKLFGNDKDILKIVEKYFIENEKTELGAENFNMSSYFFENGFKLPSAMGLTREGIRCVFSPYEAAAYVRGPIDFTVPYSAIPDFKKKAGLR